MAGWMFGILGIIVLAVLQAHWRGRESPGMSSTRPPLARPPIGVDSRPMAAAGTLDPAAMRRLFDGPLDLSDRRLRTLLHAATTWKRRTALDRRVVDQVCLVPDSDAFLQALAAWDEQSYFPILIDEPSRVLPFVRAFRPARVIRYAGRGGRPRDAASTWHRAVLAVARAWGPEWTATDAGDGPPASGIDAVVPSRRGVTAPGVVLSAPGASMLAGAAALAAGRFQPLIRIDAPTSPASSSDRAPREWSYSTVPDLIGAWGFAHAIEMRIAAIVPRHDQFGDDCDFITVAGDWPYRYRAPAERGMGEYAFDDIVGRVVDRDEPGGWLERTKRRWAFTGRLMGDPAASVAHAMGALFLQPDTALLWDTYDHTSPIKSGYDMTEAAARIGRLLGGPGRVVHRAGTEASLPHWQAALEPPRRAGLVFLNSTGGPDDFTIAGGPGRPADLPSGTPCAVATIHSFSAADPRDPATIAGRWLDQGAYVYFGSMNEPYLLAFRRPRLVAELLENGVPFGAALRQGENEVLGHPWRLVYLGDPLYRLESREGRPDPRGGRMSPEEWRQTVAGASKWPVELVSTTAGSIDLVDADALLGSYLDAAIAECLAPARSRSASDWIQRFERIHRSALEPARRVILDALAIDVFRERGEYDLLWKMLVAIPPAERAKEVWSALEACAVAQFARALASGSDGGHWLAIWDSVIRQQWPPDSRFPTQFTERTGAFANSGGSARMAAWLDRLSQAASELPEGSASAHAVERARSELKPGSR